MAYVNSNQKDPRITPRLVVRYTLLQIPSLALIVLILILVEQWITISALLFWGIIFCWAVLDVVLFPFVWRAYDWGRTATLNPMIGRRGTARDRLAPAGYVMVHGELWRAESESLHDVIEAGTPVRVKGVHGLTLIIEPESSSPDGATPQEEFLNT